MEEILSNLNVDQLLTLFVAWLPKLLAAVVLFIALWLTFRLTRKPLESVLRSAGLDAALAKMLISLYRIVILVLAGVMAAGQLGINVGAALAGLGVIGLAVGFAAKDSLSNTIAGFLIFWDKPFEVGDWITIDDNYGKVTNITMRTTRIRTLDNTYVIIPNQTVIDEVLVNHSKHGETRVQVPVGIAYKESIPKARKVLLAAVEGLEGVLGEPAPTVVVTELADSSVNLIVRVWIDDAATERPVFFRAMEACKISLDEAGIEIPFPHLQFFLDNVEDRVWDQAATKLLPVYQNGDGSQELAPESASDSQ